MKLNHSISVIIPALNEAKAIAKVIKDIPDWVDDIIVADNGSEDDTIIIAQDLGALVVESKLRGYGAACLKGMEALENCDIVVFLDGDYSDYPQEMHELVDPIIRDEVDFVVGSRNLGKAAKGSLTIPQVFGNKLACFLIFLFWRVKYTDLGPFRAIRKDALDKLNMDDKAFGWTVQMQLRAIQEGLRLKEVPVDYRVRIGKSKISGTIKGTILAGHAILGTIICTAIKNIFRKVN